MRDINCWRTDLTPALFTTEVAASEKKQSSKAWSRRKVSAGSQFIRGRGMRQYRETILNAENLD